MIRDQFLTEKMGYTHQPDAIMRVIDFSTWEGFGKLVTAMQSGKIPSTLYKIGECVIAACPFDGSFPDRFANTVAKYLGYDFRHVSECSDDEKHE